MSAIAERLLEAAERGMWEHPSEETLARLRQTVADSETILEARQERVAETQ
jgi:cobaltochelatase CobN